MDSEILMGLLGFAVLIIVALVGLLGVLLRRNNKKAVSGGSNSNAHLATIETLTRQMVDGQEALRSELRTDLTAIQKTLAKMEVTVGGCGAVQQFRERGGSG